MPHMRWRPSFTLPEAITTTAGGLLIGIFVILGSPLFAQPSLTANAAVMMPAVCAAGFSLLVGLLLGMRRHRDIAPFLFGVLGLACVVIGQYVLVSLLLVVLGGVSVLLAAGWTLLLSSAGVTVPPNVLPTFEEFLNRSV